jgi:uncharacterized membrane protein
MATTTNATRTVAAVFDSRKQSENAVLELQKKGFTCDDISVVANRNTGEFPDETAPGKGAEIAADAGIGAAIGGIGGLLLGFAGLAVPGVGPLLVAGPIIATLSGMGIGAAAGGLVGILTDAGVPKDEAHFYAEGVRRGHVLVTIHTDESRAEEARAILDQSGAVNLEDRASAWRQRGWTGHDAEEQPLSADELRRERDYFAAAHEQGDEWGTLTERPQPPAGRARIYNRESK